MIINIFDFNNNYLNTLKYKNKLFSNRRCNYYTLSVNYKNAGIISYYPAYYPSASAFVQIILSEEFKNKENLKSNIKKILKSDNNKKFYFIFN